MDTRRNFISKLGKGATYTSAVLATPPGFASPLLSGADRQADDLIIGIVGAENSHTIGFGKLFNVEKKFPGVEVGYVWGETDEFASEAREKGSIPVIVKDPAEMMGKIDALIVDHRHPKYHLEAATPFVKAGIPTFIDKPFCYRVKEGKEFLALARQHGTAVTSYSTIAQCDSIFDMKEQIPALGKINQVIRYGPVDPDSPYGGLFFYGVHLVQPLLYLFGDDVLKVQVSREGTHANATMAFQSGLFATLVFKRASYGWETVVETEKGLVELKSRVEESDPPRPYIDMVEMFRTGKEPRTHESILKCVAVLEALERSASNQKWEEVRL